MGRQTARVVVKNATDSPVKAVGLVHKYSDVYKNTGAWEVIHPGQESSAIEVEYNTGFGTTGTDWWTLSWLSDDLKTFRFSSPNNFRGLFDWVERVPDLVQTHVEPFGELAEMVKISLSPVVNQESTEGFKKHELKSDDAGNTTIVVINGDQSITLYSVSGESKCGTTAREVPRH
ncbi:hypothetical protein G7054_g4649 [Neopestalotiopsis clavispora]|nr:hypothetical protein G7054_g4649 [Neopestalotiopsis clavispora]